MRYMPAVIIACVLVLAGCSATPDTEPSQSQPAAASTQEASPTSEPAEQSQEDTLESVAGQAGIVGFARSDSNAPGATAWGQGELDGRTVKVYEFASDDAFKAFIDTVSGFGITEYNFVRDGNFAFAPDDQSQKDLIASKLG